MAGTTSTIPITIGTTVIQFPNTGASPLWSEAIIQFAELVAIQLQANASPFYVSATVQTLRYNANADINLTGNGSNLAFPSGSVRSYVFTYAVYRKSDSTSAVETGTVIGVFNTATVAWSIEHEFIGNVQSNGQSYVTFDMNSSNELLLSTVAIGGVYDGSI